MGQLALTGNGRYESGPEPTFFVGGERANLHKRRTETGTMSALPSRLADMTPEIAAVAAANGCELLHLETKGGVLRLVLDKVEGGVTLAECERVSKEVSALLDVADYGAGRYVLEVSSPGLDRQLYRPGDYERFAGRLARVTVVDPETGKKRTLVARLEGLSRPAGAGDEEAEVVLREEPKGERQQVPLKNVKTARLEIEL